MNINKVISSFTLSAIALSAVIFSSPMAEAKGGVSIAPVKQVKNVCNKKAPKVIKKASLQQPVKIAQAETKTETKTEVAGGEKKETKKVTKASKKGAKVTTKTETKETAK